MIRRYMGPSGLMPYCKNMSFANAKSSRDGDRSKTAILESPYLKDLVNREFLARSTLLHSGIAKIVALRSAKQMVRPDTRWVVALVERAQPIRNLAVCFLVGKARGWAPLAIGAALMKFPVAVAVGCAGPYPARSEFWSMRRDGPVLINVPPKEFRDCLGRTPVGYAEGCRATISTKTPLLNLCGEWLVTVFAEFRGKLSRHLGFLQNLICMRRASACHLRGVPILAQV
jgi:hypothetical protein